MGKLRIFAIIEKKKSWKFLKYDACQLTPSINYRKMTSVVGGPWHFFKSAATSDDLRKSLGVEVVNLIILFRKMAKKNPSKPPFWKGFLFFIFKLQNFATIGEKKKKKKTPN
jgi:hypothetical protein